MLNRRAARGLRIRTVTSALALLLIAPLFAAATPAAPAFADDPPGDPSTIGTGAAGSLRDYIQGTIVDDGKTELTVGDVSDNACVKLEGTVTPADIPEQYKDHPPAGDGAWEFQVCAADGDAVAKVAEQNPTVTDAKAFCKAPDPNGPPPPVKKTPCAVFVYWHPAVQEVPPAPDQSRQDYFESFFSFAPKLGFSPAADPDHGAIVNFPTWMWNTVNTTFPKVITDLGLAGGLFATAWHLNTTFETDGQKVCDVSGLQHVGTVWDDVKATTPPETASDCGYTYKNIGTYNLHGCTEWLIIAIGPFFAIVFPITACSNTPVTVKESQVLIGGDAHRAPVR